MCQSFQLSYLRWINGFNNLDALSAQCDTCAHTIVKDSEETKQIMSQCNRTYRRTVRLPAPQHNNRGHHEPEFQRQNPAGIKDIPNICLHTTWAPRTRRIDVLFFEGLQHIFSNSSSLSLTLSSNFGPRYLQYIRLLMQWKNKFRTHYKEHKRPWFRIL
jgi:hypothetical protein